MKRTNKPAFPFPTPESLKNGGYSHLLEGGQCTSYWLDRFGLKIKNDKLEPTNDLKKLWKREGLSNV